MTSGLVTEQVLLSHLKENPFVLAPMAGITDHAFRSFMKRKKAGIVVTELISATGKLVVTCTKRASPFVQFQFAPKMFAKKRSIASVTTTSTSTTSTTIPATTPTTQPLNIPLQWVTFPRSGGFFYAAGLYGLSKKDPAGVITAINYDTLKKYKVGAFGGGDVIPQTPSFEGEIIAVEQDSACISFGGEGCGSIGGSSSFRVGMKPAQIPGAFGTPNPTTFSDSVFGVLDVNGTIYFSYKVGTSPNVNEFLYTYNKVNVVQMITHTTVKSSFPLTQFPDQCLQYLGQRCLSSKEITSPSQNQDIAVCGTTGNLSFANPIGYMACTPSQQMTYIPPFVIKLIAPPSQVGKLPLQQAIVNPLLKDISLSCPGEGQACGGNDNTSSPGSPNATFDCKLQTSDSEYVTYYKATISCVPNPNMNP